MLADDEVDCPLSSLTDQRKAGYKINWSHMLKISKSEDLRPIYFSYEAAWEGG
jgi:hypothetical protein